MNNNQYKNWHLETDQNNIASLVINKADATTNVLSQDVMEELEQLITEIYQTTPKGLIIKSSKPSGFIAGADVTEFNQINSSDEALVYIKRAHETFSRLEALTIPTVCLIDGFCMGGGLELALACRYRIASDETCTRFGLPEVKLGIHPGYGGTMRLNRLIGALAAMDLMLTGRTVDARKAHKIGIVDYVIPKRHLHSAALSMMEEQPLPHDPGTAKSLFSSLGPGRHILANQFKKQVAKHAKPEHYPAPYALIKLWKEHSDSDADMLIAEAESVAQLVMTDTSKNLVRLFFLQEHMKDQGSEKAIGKNKLMHVHVIGAGVMGGDIAAWCVVQGFNVTLQDREPNFIAPALKRAKKLFKRRFKKKHLLMNAFDRLHPDHNGFGIEKADIIIEAIVEDLELKQALYQELEPRMKDDAILATNTSSIELESLSTCLKNPKRLVGIHFFNPVPKMQLVEIVSGKNTDKKTINKATDFVRAIDRLPLPVKSSPGFLVNRILMPYLLEAVELLAEGNSAEVIDRAATDFGMPMGPLTLADTVGLDICLSVATILGEKMSLAVPEKLKNMVEQGRLGKKNSQGIYDYDKKGKPIKSSGASKEAVSSDLADRMILRIINEAMACLREGVVEDAGLLDAGMVFGTGFAPFTGGPMHYIQSEGRDKLLQCLQDLESKYGQRFKADEAW